MSKDIFDKLALKNKENLSENINNNQPAAMTNDLQNLKINDDFSNLEEVEDETPMQKQNSNVKLKE